MRRKGTVSRVGEKFLSIRLQNGGSVRLKKTDFPALVEDTHVVITLTVKREKNQEWPSQREIVQRRRIRWGLHEYLRLRAAGEDPDLWALIRRGHLQLVEDNDRD